MQTFITFRSFSRVAAGLDMMRLGKQKEEALQILRALRHEKPVVGNKWAYEMWRGHEEALVLYGLFITHEWRCVRKLRDSTWGQFADLASEYGMLRAADMVKEDRPPLVAYPAWMTETWILRSHRSRLIEKMPHHYVEQFGATPVNMPYIWPIWDESAPGGYRLCLSVADTLRVETGERVLPRQLKCDKTGEITVCE